MATTLLSSNLDAALRSRLTSRTQNRRTEAARAYLEPIAEEMRRTGKRRTGHMVGSIAVVDLARGEAAIRVVLYARFVSEGHRVWNWNTSRRRHAGYRRLHPLRTGGFVRGDQFIHRAFTGAAARSGRAALLRALAR